MALETQYFEHAGLWRSWLESHHGHSQGVYLIFYAVGHAMPSMRWEEAVREALCFGWIDSTVKSLGDGKRRQYFCPRKPGSTWSRINKTHLAELMEAGRVHPSGMERIRQAQADGSWVALDQVEAGVVPPDLQEALDRSPEALSFFNSLSRTYRKSYLYWLFQAKREETRNKRISTIVGCCAAGKKTWYP
ncbi:YdeI/OmpD-associated family protein [Robiginitalea sp. M366]|uniref:YdeI/OmpD-associated family protein n=1 Tax=Robiginitalea aestuariiviva TaxID=3036903 RepID=UPI00240D81D1|nr:YdeI/OmpD-associated family protein [Robiginitalea aestuariiviva]MDG1573445.1 YdeI/OmpD-associated family protein [Robiginitalea aestuariiviva]